MTKAILSFLLILSSLGFQLKGQINSNITIEDRLSLLVSEFPQLEEEIEIDVKNIPVSNFLRALGKNNEVNISASPKIKGTIYQSFTDITLLNLLTFLCESYDLDFKLIGGVIHFFPKQPLNYQPQIQVYSNPNDSVVEYVNMDLRNDSIKSICRLITNSSSINLIYHPNVQFLELSFYIKNTPLIEALKEVCANYNLELVRKDSSLYLIKETEEQPNAISGIENINQMRFNEEIRTKSERDSLWDKQYHIQSSGAQLSIVLLQMFQHFGVDYILFDDIIGIVRADIQGSSLEECLTKLLANTEYTFNYDAPYYIVGRKSQKSLIVSKQLKLVNRPVHKLIEFLPQNLLESLEIIEFDELNSMLVTGFYPDIKILEEFLLQIDKPVPVVMIEVIIVDYQQNSDLSTGINAGIGSNPTSSGGDIYPGVNYNLNANSLNNLIQSFNGFGSLNLGTVTPNFYVNLQFLETNGLINVKSTPRITTLNGHKASISIGNTEYYVVEQTNITGVQNPIPITIRNYQSVQANFSLTITPYVANEDQVTLEIQVEQTDFTARIAPEAPPGNVSRTFNSYIRVKNEDMILLGGLEEKGYTSVGSGVPLLSRVWGLKWLFSSRNRTDNKSKLNIFIKPQVIK